MTVIDLVPHMDAGDTEFKANWTGSHDDRPLTEFGRRQARLLDQLVQFVRKIDLHPRHTPKYTPYTLKDPALLPGFS